MVPQTYETNGNRITNGTPGATSIAKAGSQPEWLTNLRAAVAKVVTPDAIEKALQAQIEKAQKGDEKALKFILEIAAKQPPAQPVNATQNVFHVHLPPGATAAEDPLLVKVYSLLEAMGPQTSGQIAANLGVTAEQVEQRLEHPWFEQGRGRGSLVVWAIRRRN